MSLRVRSCWKSSTVASGPSAWTCLCPCTEMIAILFTHAAATGSHPEIKGFAKEECPGPSRFPPPLQWHSQQQKKPWAHPTTISWEHMFLATEVSLCCSAGSGLSLQLWSPSPVPGWLDKPTVAVWAQWSYDRHSWPCSTASQLNALAGFVSPSDET